MAMLPDLVRYSKLSTHFFGAETIHTSLESDPTSGKRVTALTEQWQHHEKIGMAHMGVSWVEKFVKDKEAHEFEPKQISLDSRLGPVDYTRELEAIVKFSSSNISA